MTDGSVKNNVDEHRFELEVDGETAASYYRRAPGVITFIHTEVPPALSGRGVGSLDTGDFMPSVTMSNDIGVAGPNSPVGQSNTIWHEFGHAIGLPHIGITSSHKPCLKGMANPQDGNFPACYLGPTQDDSLNVMGSGDKVSTRNSLPWLLRAPLHTGTSLADWKVALPTRPPRVL